MPRSRSTAVPTSISIAAPGARSSLSPTSHEACADSSPPGFPLGSCPWLGIAPDVLLARSAARGDDLACQELIRRYQDRIYTVAYGYVRDREEALDITQETFLQMLKGLPNFREQANFYTWLHRIVLNRCIDWGRRRTRCPPPMSLDDLVNEGWAEPADRRAEPQPDQALVAKELHGKIQAAIDAVPEMFRRVLLLADVEGLSMLEIADRLRCPVNTVKTRLHRGRSLVRKRLRTYIEGGC